jgi:thioredoxin 2
MSGVIVPCSGCQVKNRIPEKKQHLSPLCGKCGHKIVVGPLTVPVNLGDEDFQQFIKSSDIPVMVDFFAPTCGPCQAIAPLISRLAGSYAGRVVVAKINTSDHPGTAAHYQIRGVPTLLFFKNGLVVDQIVGAPPESQLVAKLEDLVRDV